jgi:tetratricopeptide (TPR) repeat protein
VKQKMHKSSLRIFKKCRNHLCLQRAFSCSTQFYASHRLFSSMQQRTFHSHNNNYYYNCYSTFKREEHEETGIGSNHYEQSFEQHVKAITKMISSEDNNTLQEAKALLDQWYVYLLKNNPSNGQQTMEEKQYFLYWKLFIGKCYTTVLYRLGEYEDALLECDRVFQIENELDEYEMVDESFFELNYICSIKVQCLVSLDRLKDALQYVNFLIEERLEKGLKNIRFEELSKSEKFQLRMKITEQLQNELTTRATILYSMGELDKALKDLNRVLKKTKNPEALKLRSTIYMDKSDVRNAFKDAQTLMGLNLDPKMRNTARLTMIYCLMKDNQFDKALELCNECIRFDKKMEEVYGLRSACFLSMNKYEKALEDIKIIEQLSPNSLLDIIPFYVKCLSRLARFDELMTLCDRLPFILETRDLPTQEKNDILLLQPLSRCNWLRWTGKNEEAYKFFIENIEPRTDIVSQHLIPSIIDMKLKILIDNGKDFQKALTVADEYVKICKFADWYDCVESWSLRAVVWAHLKEFNKANIDLQMARSKLDTVVEEPSQLQELEIKLKHATGKVLCLQGQEKRLAALDIFKEAMELAERCSMIGDLVYILRDLSNLEKELGLVEKADEHLIKLRQYAPSI